MCAVLGAVAVFETDVGVKPPPPTSLMCAVVGALAVYETGSICVTTQMCENFALTFSDKYYGFGIKWHQY